MSYTIDPGTWTFVGDTGVEVRYDGPDGPQELEQDEQGALLLPAMTPEEWAGESYWMARAGSVPLTRIDQPFDLDDPARWPGGFELVEGKWRKLPD